MIVEELDFMTLDELIDTCMTDPAHIAYGVDQQELEYSDNSVSGQWKEHGYY